MATHMTPAEMFLMENRIECPFPKGNIELVSIEVAFKALRISNKPVCSDGDMVKQVLIDFFEDMKKADAKCYGISPDTIISWLKTR